MFKKILLFVIIISSITKIQAQCSPDEKTITICDMTIIDGDTNGDADGIINLFTRYNALPGVTPVDASMGTWFDPNFNFALDGSGNLYLWDLDKSSEAETDHQFHFLSTTSGCPDDILIRLNVVVGPFSGNAFPPNANNVNIQICDSGSTPRDRCDFIVDIDLFQALDPIPSPHLNGEWVYNGGGSGFIRLDGSYLTVTIPYTEGPPLVDEQVFRFTYIVPGMNPCNLTDDTDVNVSVVRKVFSGYSKNKRICEDAIKNGNYDADLNLRDDEFLAHEDIEGVWTGDAFNQIANSLDSRINIKDVYDQIIARDGVKFGCAQVNYNYSVEQRSGVCADTTSTVSFKIYEDLRPFNQNSTIPSYCEDDVRLPATINLYDQLEFTIENGVLFDYNRNTWTNWSHVSGPSDLGLISNTNPAGYSSLGTVSLVNAPPGDYVFEYTVYPQYNCWPDNFQVLDYTPDYCNSTVNSILPCMQESARVRFTIHPKLYAGEDTSGLQFCETDPLITNPLGLELIDLLNDNGIETIYRGSRGRWVDLSTGNPILNPFTVPLVNNQQTFNFEYITTSVNDCEDRARLSFTVYEEYQSGTSNPEHVCNTNPTFNLFDRLGGNPNTTGTWSGPNGFTTTDHNAMFDPTSSEAGDYTYTVPDNVDSTGAIICSGNSVTVTVILHQSPNVGSDGGPYPVCRSDSQIDLEDYLDAAVDLGGTFEDLDTTDALTGSLLDVSQLVAGTYRFQYGIQGHASCGFVTAIISIDVTEVDPPIAINQSFCAIQGSTISELQANNDGGNGIDFNWYDTATSANPLALGTVLINGEDYYVSALDSEDCESERVQIAVTILPLDDPSCDSCFKDGISVNGDGENDVFDLCGYPAVFPNFELNIYNRYGTIVYKGNRNTPLFEGKSNVSLTVGDELPSGVYFYVFDPRDGATDPIQGNFYLSR